MRTDTPEDFDEMQSIFLDAIKFDDKAAWNKIIYAAQNGTYDFNRFVNLTLEDLTKEEKYSFLGHAIIGAKNGMVAWEHVNAFIDTKRVDTKNVFLSQGVFSKSAAQLLEIVEHFNHKNFTEGSLELYRKLGGNNHDILQTITPLDKDFKTSLERYNQVNMRPTNAPHPLRELMSRFKSGMNDIQLTIFQENIEQLCVLDEYEKYIRERIKLGIIYIGDTVKFAFHPHSIGDHDVFFRNYSGIAMFQRFNLCHSKAQSNIIEILFSRQYAGCLNATLEELASDINTVFSIEDKQSDIAARGNIQRKNVKFFSDLESVHPTVSLNRARFSLAWFSSFFDRPPRLDGHPVKR